MFFADLVERLLFYIYLFRSLSSVFLEGKEINFVCVLVFFFILVN